MSSDLEKAAIRLIDVQTRLIESALSDLHESTPLDLTQLYGLDPRDLGIGDHPAFYQTMPHWQGLALMDRQMHGEFIPAFLSEPQLRWYRRRIRALCVNSEVALNVCNTRVSYAIGKGLNFEAQPKLGRDVDQSIVDDVQAIIDAFVDHNELETVEAESLVRMDIDGEAFLRLFPNDSGILSVRFIEPEYVRSPTGDSDENSFGILQDGDDVQSIKGYWVSPDLGDQPELLDPMEVCHLKHPDTPATSKRGLSAFFPVETTLRMVEDLLQSTVSLAKTRAKIALIRKLSGTTSSLAQSLINNLAVAQGNDPATNTTVNVERLRYGTILTVPETADVEMPSANISAGDHAAVMQMVLRVVGTRFSMPEYLVSGDASNANYSSTMVAESPFVKAMERLQTYLIRFWAQNRYGAKRAIIWRQLAHAVQMGLLPNTIFRLIDIQTTAPTLTVRDVAKEAQVDQIYNGMGVKSITTIQLEQGLDVDEETANFKKEAASQPQQGATPGEANPLAGLFGGAEDADNDGLINEACVPNKSGQGYHDTETGYPCAKPGAAATTGASARKKSKKLAAAGAAPEAKKAIFSGLLKIARESGVMQAATELASRIGEKFPRTSAIAMGIYHVMEAPRHFVEKLAYESAVERGLKPEQLKTVSSFLSQAALIEEWGLGIPVAHKLLHIAGVDGVAGFALSKLGALVPVCALGYLARSAAKNPMAFIRAARNVIKGQAHKQHESELGADFDAILDQLLDRADMDEWYWALLAVATDQVKDVRQAISIADDAYGNSTPPDDDVSEEIRRSKTASGADYCYDTVAKKRVSCKSPDDAKSKSTKKTATSTSTTAKKSTPAKSTTAKKTATEPKPKAAKLNPDDLAAKIKDMKAAGKVSKADAESLAKDLMGLSVAQLNTLKKTLGLSASGAKAQLAAKLAEKALAAAEGGAKKTATKDKAKDSTPPAKSKSDGPLPPKDGYSGVDTLGREWKNGKLTGKVEPVKKSMFPKILEKVKPLSVSALKSRLDKTSLKRLDGINLPDNLPEPHTKKAIQQYVQLYKALDDDGRDEMREMMGVASYYDRPQDFENVLNRVARQNANKDDIQERIRSATDLHKAVADIASMSSEQAELARKYDEVTAQYSKALNMPGGGAKKVNLINSLATQQHELQTKLLNIKHANAMKVSGYLKQRVKGDAVSVEVKDGSNMTPLESKEMQKGVEFWQGICAAGGKPLPPIETYKATHADGTPNPRAHYNHEGNKINWQGGYPDARTAVHEIGHAIEMHNPEILALAQDFVAKRIEGEKKVKLAEKFPNSNYTPDEEGALDRFGETFDSDQRGYYAGKTYGGTATEIISLGMDTLYADPVGMARRDPEFTAFMLGILDGSLRYKDIPDE